MAAELRLELADEHVPRLELHAAQVTVGDAIRCADHRGIAMQEARAWIDFEDRVAGCERGAHELSLDIVAAVAQVAALRTEKARFRKREAQE